jgi:hypothetical protein
LNTGKGALALVRREEICFQPFAFRKFAALFKATGETRLAGIAASWEE